VTGTRPTSRRPVASAAPAAPAAPVLSRRELNRATLARQLLLDRVDLEPAAAVARLLAPQAQEPRPPAAGLWSRLSGFGLEDYRAALDARELVRATFARATLHLMTAEDYLEFRPGIAPVLSAAFAGVAGRLGGEPVDLERLLPAARTVLAAGPLRFDEIRERLRPRFPEVNVRALGYAVRMHLPLVMVPTEDRWGFPPTAAFTLAESWLAAAEPGFAAAADGAGPEPGESTAPLVRRYLAAYGPASVADMRAWTGLGPRDLRPAFESLRGELLTFRDEQGKELFDLPDAPRPGPDVTAPARFLPDFDSLLLAHADRERIVATEHRPQLATKNLRVPAVFCWDGFAAGRWAASRRGKKATLTMSPFGPMPRGALRALTAEGEHLLAFMEPDAASTAVVVADD